ncbi:hypothetical protein [Paenibacillus sp. NPDC058071]|uniref:hypothetical protein n=1 Tax=Paenibacillus sp. NPDC058071 TaxID=3346326 RepID=UPI0036D82E94
MTVAMATTLIVIGACTSAGNEASPASNLTPSTAQNEIDDAKDLIFNNALKDGIKYSFTIDPGYGWVKVLVKNDTSSEMTVRVTQGSLTGAEKMLFTVPANSQEYLTGTAAWSTGEFHVAVSSKISLPLSGLLSVKSATTEKALIKL